MPMLTLKRRLILMCRIRLEFRKLIAIRALHFNRPGVVAPCTARIGTLAKRYGRIRPFWLKPLIASWERVPWWRIALGKHDPTIYSSR